VAHANTMLQLKPMLEASEKLLNNLYSRHTFNPWNIRFFTAYLERSKGFVGTRQYSEKIDRLLNTANSVPRMDHYMMDSIPDSKLELFAQNPTPLSAVNSSHTSTVVDLISGPDIFSNLKFQLGNNKTWLDCDFDETVWNGMIEATDDGILLQVQSVAYWLMIQGKCVNKINHDYNYGINLFEVGLREACGKIKSQLQERHPILSEWIPLGISCYNLGFHGVYDEKIFDAIIKSQGEDGNINYSYPGPHWLHDIKSEHLLVILSGEIYSNLCKMFNCGSL